MSQFVINFRKIERPDATRTTRTGQPLETDPAEAAALLILIGPDRLPVRAQQDRVDLAYVHLWPDTEESTRAAVDLVPAARADSLRTRVTS